MWRESIRREILQELWNKAVIGGDTMIKIIFYSYIFIRWTGGWGGHSGMGAFLFFCIWTAFMALSVWMATFGPLLTIVSLGKLFRCNTDQLRYCLIRIVRTPGGMAFLFGHLGSMGITALICYFGYYLTPESTACVAHWGAPSLFEWPLLAWYGYSVYSFFKNVGTLWDTMS